MVWPTNATGHLSLRHIFSKITLFDECSQLDVTYSNTRFNDNYNTNPEEKINFMFTMDYLGFFGYEQSTDLFFDERTEADGFCFINSDEKFGPDNIEIIEVGNISETTSLISLNVFFSTPLEQITNIFFSCLDVLYCRKSIRFCLTD